MPFRLNGAAVESGGPEDRLLPWDRVQDMAGISRTTAWRMQRSGAFPTPVVVSPGRVAWWESELTAWKGARGDVASLQPPVRPRLPGMPRRAPIRTPVQAAPPTPVVQPDLLIEPEALLEKPTRTRRRSGRLNADQIDFGF